MIDMEYSKIISVTGLGGLFELLSSKADGAIVRSLEDKSTRFVSSRVHNFSHLESIEIFTVRDNVNLADVFLAMQKDTTPLPTEKDNAAVKKYFEAVYPDMDFERVYTSDMKKMVKWYDILKANDLLKFEEMAAANQDSAGGEALNEKKPAEEKPVVGKKISLPVQKRHPEKLRANRKTGG